MKKATYAILAATFAAVPSLAHAAGYISSQNVYEKSATLQNGCQEFRNLPAPTTNSVVDALDLGNPDRTDSHAWYWQHDDYAKAIANGAADKTTLTLAPSKQPRAAAQLVVRLEDNFTSGAGTANGSVNIYGRDGRGRNISEKVTFKASDFSGDAATATTNQAFEYVNVVSIDNTLADATSTDDKLWIGVAYGHVGLARRIVNGSTGGTARSDRDCDVHAVYQNDRMIQIRSGSGATADISVCPPVHHTSKSADVGEYSVVYLPGPGPNGVNDYRVCYRERR